MSDDKKIIFSMDRVSKTFSSQKKVLNNINLSFFYGAKIGIIGLNGSGKSTLLKIIAGLESSYDGHVVWSKEHNIGYLAQEPILDDEKTVREIVEEGAQEVVDLLKEYDEINGKFFASAPKQLTGPLVMVDMPRFEDRAAQEALWTVTSRVAGIAVYPAAGS